MPEITKISPTIAKIPERPRVAAYARVSMETELLHHSLSAQVSHYSQMIQDRPDWEFAGIYADEGITGTSTRYRAEFNRLIDDCEAGKIDMVLVKSISRFARDTVDCLNVTRHLKELNINVYFERENINSISEDGELLLTLLASFAQEESRSISENVKWSIRKGFELGIPNGHKAPYGYEWTGEQFRAILSQAETVKYIFHEYLSGRSAYNIAKELGNMNDSTVKEILSNYSYTGTMILQKSFTDENHKRRVNNGELPRYAVSEMFEPIISEDTYQAVQDKKAANAAANYKNITLTPFSGLVRCGNCGRGVSRRSAKNGKKWVCNTRERKGISTCDMRPISEDELTAAAAKSLGSDTFDGTAFRAVIKQIVIWDDCIEFIQTNGKRKKIYRSYSGYKHRGPFSGKLICPCCGRKYHSDTWKGKKVWICPAPRSECPSQNISEDELRGAAISILGKKHYELEFVKQIKEVTVFRDKLDFIFKDRRTIIWHRK